MKILPGKFLSCIPLAEEVVTSWRISGSWLWQSVAGASVNRENRKKKLGFEFRIKAHEPGVRKVLGKRYADTGLDQGQNILRDLARHEKTAEQVS